MFAHALATSILGIFLHQTEPLIESMDTTSDSLRLMSRYGVGVLGNLPAFNWFMKYVGIDAKTRRLVNLAYVVSFVFLGVGVFAARVLQSFPPRPQAPPE